ncbi:MAG: DUF262 domain-containing HNH endonuclease family protein [Candidatus Muiribacteriota bacterium]
MDIKAAVKNISQLKDYYFFVPDYQREYVWEADDQVEQFIMDIDNEFDGKVEINSQKSYFIGSIIIVKNNDKFEVIDGQQRLTTIVISLCAFRDLLDIQENKSSCKNYLKTIEELLSNFDMVLGKTEVRLELQYEESKDYLTNLINKIKCTEDETPSIKKMKQAYDNLYKHYNFYLEQNLESLLKYVRYFLTKIELVVLESENLSSALKIFETINQRGAGLNAMDLVKNLLFSEASEDKFHKIKGIWKEIMKQLHKCKEDSKPLRFLRYFLIARYHEGIIREDEIYKWFISEVGKNVTEYESDPLLFAKVLEKAAKRYSNLVNATILVKEGGDYPSVTNIGFINKYMSRQHLILLLALDLNAKNEVIEYLAQQIESFFFYSNTMGIQAKVNEVLFAKWAKELRGKNSIEEIEKIIEKTFVPYIASKIPQFKNVFLNITHIKYNPVYRLRYILGKMENTVSEKANLPLNGNDFFSNLQIEHILPKTPKDGFITDEFSDIEDYNDMVSKLGNVLLLESTINQSINNYNDLKADWFEAKQKEYSKSNLRMTNLMNPDFKIGKNTATNKFKNDYNYSFDIWDKNNIKQRQKILMEIAFDTWKFNGKRIDKYVNEISGV